MAKIFSKDTMDKLIHLEMMQLDEKDLVFDNFLMKWGRPELENPILATFRVLRNPEYIYFSCKYVLNVRLLPYQQVILQELWKSTFPMLVASRGAGKCVAASTFVVTNYGISTLGELAANCPVGEPIYPYNLQVLGESGFNEVDYYWNNGESPCKTIRTQCGYEISCTLNHPLRVIRNNCIEWVDANDIRIGDVVPIDRSDRWPSNEDCIGPEEAYLLGVKSEEEFPQSVLSSSKEVIAAFIRGLMDTHGRGLTFKFKSKKLATTLHFVLTRFGIISRLEGYYLYIDDTKNDITSNYYYDRVVSIKDSLHITYDVHMKSDNDRSFISNGFISHNSFLLAVYAILRALWMPGRKVVITGAGFRQAKTVMHYVETIWYNAPVLRSMVKENYLSGPHHDADRWTMRLGDSTITAIPMGDGAKIRGERAHDIIAEEFASIARETFETVVAGFGVVELEPYDKVQRAAEIRVLKRFGLWSSELEEHARATRVGNQSIISGTAYYQFNHFAEYWKRWHGIISSQGDRDKLAQVIGPEAAEEVDWRDYSIIRLPVELLPPGYMDERHVARSRATVHTGIFMNEFGAVFSSDTNGFFKRSLVESCVTNQPIFISNEWVQFHCVIRGNPNGKYIFGVDPASESDKFSIVVLEQHDTHRRIVYCWTTDKAEHTKRMESGLQVERDFYGFCARKIRELMRLFPCEHIAIDSQGGGIAVREALHDPEKMDKDELPIWEIKSSHPFSTSKGEKPTDRYAGLHILELCHFVRPDYMAEANHGLRKDFEDKVVLFPMSHDTATLAVAFEQDQIAKRQFDTYEDCFNEIEELKEELATIVHTQTPGSNRDRWDTPEVKLAGSRKGRLRKDRYSALVMANYAARRFSRKPEEVPYQNFGGFVGHMKHTDKNAPAYLSGPDWFINPIGQTGAGVGKIIRRGI